MLQPVQKLVATLIFAKGENVNESLPVYHVKTSFVYLKKEAFFSDAFLAERDAHCVRAVGFARDARLRRVSGSHRITYHSAAESLITCLQTRADLYFYDFSCKSIRGIPYTGIPLIYFALPVCPCPLGGSNPSVSLFG